MIINDLRTNISKNCPSLCCHLIADTRISAAVVENYRRGTTQRAMSDEILSNVHSIERIRIPISFPW